MNNFSKIHALISRSLLLAMTALLVACGGGGASSGGEAPASSSVPDIVAQTAALEWQPWFAEGMAELKDYPDRDRDGLTDAADPWPDNAPTLRDSSLGEPLYIERLWTELEEGRVLDTAVEGYRLHLQVRGLPTGSAKIWLVYQTREGLRAVTADVTGPGLLSAATLPDVAGVHIVIGSSRSLDYALTYLYPSEPVLLAHTEAVGAGGEVLLAGRNLEGVSDVLLGDVSLAVLASEATSVTVRLPEVATDNRLVLLTEDNQSNVLELNLRQTVTVQVDPALALDHDEELSFWLAGNEYRADYANPTTISVPAWYPVVLYFDVLTPTGIRLYNRITAVVWPGDSTVGVSAASTLLGRLINMRQHLPGGKGTDWAQMRSDLTLGLTTPAALDFINALESVVGGGSDFAQEAYVFAAAEAYTDLVKATASASSLLNVRATSEITPLPGRFLDDVIGSTVTYAGEGPDADAPNGGDYVYPRETLGNDYAQIVIVPHEDIRLVNRDLQFFSTTCNYGPPEGTWRGTHGLNIWDSDLCIQVDGPVFISAAVIKPALQDVRPIIEQMDNKDLVPNEVVRRHAKPKFMDADYMLGQGGYYLKADDKSPLCNMETCYIEIISSGYGYRYKVNLTATQQALVETMRVRMWTEAIVPAMLSVAGITTDSHTAGELINAGSCLRNAMLADGQLYTVLSTMTERIKKATGLSGDDLTDEITEALDITVGGWANNYVSNHAVSDYLTCLSGLKPPNLISDAVNENLKLLPPTKSRPGFFTFADVLKFVSDLGAVVLTPEKMVFKMDPRARVTNIQPQTIDLYQEESTLKIDGNWLAKAPCAAADGWCPQLVFEDQYGQEEVLFLNESHIGTPAAGAGLGATRLEIPYVEFLQKLQSFSGSDLKIKLAYPDFDYRRYPDERLPVPVPEGVMYLKTKAKLHGFKPPLGTPGGVVTMLGSRLDIYGATPQFTLIDSSNRVTTHVLQKEEDSPESKEEVRLKIPLGVPHGMYKVLMVKDPAVGITLPNITSTAEFWISPGQPNPTLIVGDLGEFRDDNMYVEMVDAGDNLVAWRSDITRSFAFHIPTNELTPPVGKRVYAFSWLDGIDPSNNQPYITAPVKRILVSCEDPGVDKTCSYGLRSLAYQVCGQKFPGKPDPVPQTSVSGKLDKAGQHVFVVADNTAISCAGISY